MTDFLDTWLKERDRYAESLKKTLKTAEERDAIISKNKELIISARQLITKVNSSKNRIKHLKHMIETTKTITINCKNNAFGANRAHPWKPAEVFEIDILREHMGDPVKCEIYSRMIEETICYECAERQIKQEYTHEIEKRITKEKQEKQDAIRAQVQTEIEGIVTFAPDGSPGYYCAKLADGKILYFNSVLNIAGVRSDKP